MHKIGFQRLSVEKFKSHGTEKFRGGTLLCFRNFLVQKKIWIRRECHVFPSKFFCPKLPKNIVGEPSCVSELIWYQNSLDNRGITILSIFLVSYRQKSPCANRSVFQKYSCFKIFWIIGASRFCRLFLSHSAEKFVENPPMIQKN